VHEAIHQLAFNTGLHVRMGHDPRWVVEGLATTLEPEPVRRPLRSDVRPLDRTNPERLQTYLENVSLKREVTSAALIADDEAFHNQPLAAYATAWAMSFYLLETRSGEYAQYLRTLSAKSPLQTPSPSERLADFQAAFGGLTPSRLDTDMTRYLQRIAAGEKR
jgi:hypothetical protein